MWRKDDEKGVGTVPARQHKGSTKNGEGGGVTIQLCRKSRPDTDMPNGYTQLSPPTLWHCLNIFICERVCVTEITPSQLLSTSTSISVCANDELASQLN